VGAFGETVPASMANQLSELVPRYSRRRHLAAYRALRDAGLRLAADPSIGFALLHLPVPHAPPIYDAARGQFSFARPEGPGYFDNLALADRTFAELRRVMERAGTWDRTAVVVFGDHGRRSLADEARIAHPTVPFLLKLPGRPAPRAYADGFSLARLRGLTRDILSGKVTTTDEAQSWVDARPR
jgi:arylsulfatase A-like enzyme